jgi:hypothetical protein
MGPICKLNWKRGPVPFCRESFFWLRDRSAICSFRPVITGTYSLFFLRQRDRQAARQPAGGAAAVAPVLRQHAGAVDVTVAAGVRDGRRRHLHLGGFQNHAGQVSLLQTSSIVSWSISFLQTSLIAGWSI